MNEHTIRQTIDDVIRSKKPAKILQCITGKNGYTDEKWNNQHSAKYYIEPLVDSGTRFLAESIINLPLIADLYYLVANIAPETGEIDNLDKCIIMTAPIVFWFACQATLGMIKYGTKSLQEGYQFWQYSRNRKNVLDYHNKCGV